MIWLSWRQVRLQALVGAGFGLVVAVVAVATGRTMHELVASVPNPYDALRSSDISLFYAGVVVLAIAPALIGAFWGAPMVAREVEQGTHLLIWNQSITRTRWLLTKFGVTLLVSVAVVGLLSAAVSWWSGPLDGATGERTGALPARITPVSFAMRGLAPVAYVVFALALGVAVGAVIRRTLPAMALTIALVVAVQIIVPNWIRPHLVAAEDVTVPIKRENFSGIQIGPGDRAAKLTVSLGDREDNERVDWILSNTTVDAGGHPAELPAWMSDCLPPPDGPPTEVTGRAEAPPIDQCLDRLTAEGYQQRIVYQPASRFWSLQLREAGLFVVLAALLMGFAVWWTRTRLV